jgi:hypothetical protein
MRASKVTDHCNVADSRLTSELSPFDANVDQYMSSGSGVGLVTILLRSTYRAKTAVPPSFQSTMRSPVCINMFVSYGIPTASLKMYRQT